VLRRLDGYERQLQTNFDTEQLLPRESKLAVDRLHLRCRRYANALARDLDQDLKLSWLHLLFLSFAIPPQRTDGLGHFKWFLHALTENKGLTFSDSRKPAVSLTSHAGTSFLLITSLQKKVWVGSRLTFSTRFG
jgi:hypothetical protein